MRAVALLLLALALTACGAAPPDRDAQRERWNSALTGEDAMAFERAANALLVQAVEGAPPGRALDVGMGQGRNALFLAARGWDVTGFDIADEAVAEAQATAAAQGLGLATQIAGIEDFAFGEARWDLIALIYLAAPIDLDRVAAGLAPGGLVVLEHFRATAEDYTGAGAFPDEILRRRMEAAGLEVVRYEEVTARADFGLEEAPLVRVIARKPVAGGALDR